MTETVLGTSYNSLSQARCQWNDLRSSGRERRTNFQNHLSDKKQIYKPTLLSISHQEKAVFGKPHTCSLGWRLPFFPPFLVRRRALGKPFPVLRVSAGRSTGTPRQTGNCRVAVASRGPCLRDMILGDKDTAVPWLWSWWGCCAPGEAGCLCPFT